MNSFVIDEVDNILKAAKKNRILPTATSENEYTICGENHDIIYYLLSVLLLRENVNSPYKINIIVNGFPNNTLFFEEIIIEYCKKFKKIDETFDYTSIVKIYSSFEEYGECNHSPANVFVFLANCNSIKYDDLAEHNLVLEELQTALRICSMEQNAKFLLVEFMPKMRNLINTNGAIAEREYEVYAAQYSDHSMEAFPIKLENCCRSYMEIKSEINVLRVCNVFGPMINNPTALKIEEFAEEIRRKKSITVSKSDYFDKFSACYVRNAMMAILLVSKFRKTGNIYNCASISTDNYRIGIAVGSAMISEGVSLNIINNETSNNIQDKNQSFACNKLLNLGWKPINNLNEQLYRTILSINGADYNSKAVVDSIYGNKLDLIKALELNVMEEIDRICQKHNIKYFLVGGSLLGAVRHKGFIPWDDDLDIGMLRDDFEKFRKICPMELSDKYAYQSYTNEPQSHYIFDKIRLKDTYFTTAFSNRFSMENGIFIDILVYDKTANTLSAQKKHIRTLNIWKRAINVRWVNKARKNIHYRKTKLLLPIMRLVPFSWYHKLYEKKLRKYNKKDNCKYLIDGVGMNLNKGAFPAEWFDDIIECSFEDRTFPIPKMYDEYLRHWYGDRYMELLPISSRNSGHTMARIDLGEHLSDQTTGGDFHQLDFRGELYEKTRSELSGKTSE